MFELAKKKIPNNYNCGLYVQKAGIQIEYVQQKKKDDKIQIVCVEIKNKMPEIKCSTLDGNGDRLHSLDIEEDMINGLRPQQKIFSK